MEEQGGFGKFQWIITPFLILSINTTGYLLYLLSGYILLSPKFICHDINGDIIDPDNKQECVPDYFCKSNNQIKWEADKDDPYILDN